MMVNGIEELLFTDKQKNSLQYAGAGRKCVMWSLLGSGWPLEEIPGTVFLLTVLLSPEKCRLGEHCKGHFFKWSREETGILQETQLSADHARQQVGCVG